MRTFGGGGGLLNPGPGGGGGGVLNRKCMGGSGGRGGGGGNWACAKVNVPAVIIVSNTLMNFMLLYFISVELNTLTINNANSFLIKL